MRDELGNLAATPTEDGTCANCSQPLHRERERTGKPMRLVHPNGLVRCPEYHLPRLFGTTEHGDHVEIRSDGDERVTLTTEQILHAQQILRGRP